jgi:hypothetical protein
MCIHSFLRGYFTDRHIVQADDKDNEQNDMVQWYALVITHELTDFFFFRLYNFNN